MAISAYDIAQFDAIGLATEIQRGSFSASEVLEASIEAIERLNPKLNAVICKLFAEAREQLTVLKPEAPFYGVPFLAKDLFVEIAGTPGRSREPIHIRRMPPFLARSDPLPPSHLGRSVLNGKADEVFSVPDSHC